ncbi:MAG: D-alanyl-D-alanine carboxypeptidase, partial [Clostridia bacterium]|nr:D-alanyl-D-alanine carboxypeptidase [Clostridia bacterium]
MKTDFFNINAARCGCGNYCAINEGRPARGFRAAAVRAAALILTALLITAAALPAVSIPAQAASAPELYGDAAVLINADTGEILYDKNRMRQMYPASTTKIMTVMLALENLDLDSKITVSADAEAQDGSELGLVAGEQITVKDAVYGTMLLSANDAAWALAEAVSGDVQSFAKLMNEKAADLGCLNTYFVTPNGLPNDSHVTSPMDMAKIAQAAMKEDTFREVVGTYQYTVSATNKSAPRPVTNTNRLLFDLSTVNVYGAERTFKYEGCTGVKTGHTNAAGYCLVASAERDGANLIGVIFHSTEAQIYPDMIKLLDFGFTGYAPKTIVKAGDVVGTAKVKYGSPGSVDVATEEDVVAMVEADAEGNPAGNLKGYSYTLNINEINAPVTKGTVAGTLTLYNGTDELGSFDLVATENVEMSAFHSLFKSGSWAKGYILMIGAVLVVSVLGYVGITFQMRRSARKQRNARRKRRMMKRIQEQRAEAAEKEAAALAAEREAEEAAGKNETPVEEGDLSRMNLLGADEMPDFGEDDGQAAASIESVRASTASSPDRVSDLFSRIQAQQAENSGAAGTTTPTAP